MKSVRLLVLAVICGLFYFSEGKPCPEKTRPHKSRCDAYFKCTVLPSKNHVWVPENCEQGLIFEPNLQLCVLPGDDWECNLGEVNGSIESDDDNVLNGVGVDGLSDVEDPELKENDEDDDSADEDIKGDYISVDNGSEISEREIESSGDGGGPDYIILDTTSPESKTNNDDSDMPVRMPTKIDPKLTAHLQRLSQLIDGLKQTYQSKDSASSDLRPDQLNAFLAHYNIKAQLDSIDPLEEELKVKNRKPSNDTLVIQSTTPSTSQLDPETKVVLTNHLPTNFVNPRPTDGYSNSQIVVNKPEGSVLFTLGNHPQESSNDHRNDPKISEETLKTVLELSKQMIENQNIRQVVPNSAYYPQVVQPIYLPPPIPQFPNSIFNQHDGYEDKKYDKDSSTYFVSKEKPEKPATTIIHNNVIPVHVSSSPNDKQEQVDSYGQTINAYPPLQDYQNTNTETVDSQNHRYKNRYENNQLVTIRPNPLYSNYNNYQHQLNYRPTSTPKPYISDSGSTLTDYYTPSPHLDETNVNNVFQVERYPTINYGNLPTRPLYPQSSYNPNRPEQSYIPNKQSNTHYSSQPYQNYYYPNQQSILQLFPSRIDPSKVKIRPNSQKLESMEQETAEDIEPETENRPSSIGNDNGQLQSYNPYNTNSQIMTSQLAQYVEQLNGNKPYNFNSINSNYPSRNKPQITSQIPVQNDDQSLLSNLDHNFLPYGLLKTSVTLDEIKNDCPAGVRQPNVTDCTKYYVCSKADGRAMQYTCPSYTAFNPQSRICDPHYFALCNPGAVASRFTVSENHRIQLEAIKALQDAKRIRDQAYQAQNLALRLRLGESENDGNKKYSAQSQLPPQYSSDTYSNFLKNEINSNSLLLGGNSINNNKTPSLMSSNMQRPHTSGSTVTRKRKYYCKEGDKVADQTSIYSYFVCYKNPQGMMKGHKMTCTEGLLFCPMTTMCTLPSRCT